MKAQIDYLVIAANTLKEGVAWCERTLGITPGPGGKHPLMGTHNRLFSIATAQYPTAYLEIIAISKEAACARKKGDKRCFDLDNETLQRSLKQNGLQLVISSPARYAFCPPLKHWPVSALTEGNCWRRCA